MTEIISVLEAKSHLSHLLQRVHAGDPFDRMLAAQAQIEGLSLVGTDHALRQFGVKFL